MRLENALVLRKRLSLLYAMTVWTVLGAVLYNEYGKDRLIKEDKDKHKVIYSAYLPYAMVSIFKSSSSDDK